MLSQPPRNNEKADGYLENGRYERIAISIDGRLKKFPSGSCRANRNGRRNRNRGHGLLYLRFRLAFAIFKLNNSFFIIYPKVMFLKL
jgi:hypothetical protein